MGRLGDPTGGISPGPRTVSGESHGKLTTWGVLHPLHPPLKSAALCYAPPKCCARCRRLTKHDQTQYDIGQGDVWGGDEGTPIFLGFFFNFFLGFFFIFFPLLLLHLALFAFAFCFCFCSCPLLLLFAFASASAFAFAFASAFAFCFCFCFCFLLFAFAFASAF